MIFYKGGSIPYRWEFREYTSRIAGQPNKFAKVGVPYVYTPKIWDAQMSCMFPLPHAVSVSNVELTYC